MEKREKIIGIVNIMIWLLHLILSYYIYRFNKPDNYFYSRGIFINMCKTY